MTNHKKEIVVFLEGGTGNQLFMYAAGLYLAEKYGCSLRLIDSMVGAFGPNHGSHLALTNLPGEFNNPKWTTNISGLTAIRISKSIARRNFLFRKLLKKLFFQFHSNSIGFDDLVLRLTPPIRLFGYFQTWRYLSELKFNVFEKMTLKRPTSWMSQMSTRLENENPIIVHIRLGDYLQHLDSFGALSDKYYEIAIETISKGQNSRKIWVFSDDIDEAKRLLSFVDSGRLHWITPPPESPPIESLLLMSQAKFLVIAKSTFSYWAAIIGNSKKIVVAPTKWFRGMPDPVELMPNEWKRVPSHWL